MLYRRRHEVCCRAVTIVIDRYGLTRFPVLDVQQQHRSAIRSRRADGQEGDGRAAQVAAAAAAAETAVAPAADGGGGGARARRAPPADGQPAETAPRQRSEQLGENAEADAGQDALR